MFWYKKLKVLKCYLFIIGWLGVLLLYLSYWKIDDHSQSAGPLPKKLSNILSPDKLRHKKTRIHCNTPEKIKLGHESEVNEKFDLRGILLLTRHGDRGPLRSVRNLSSIDCSGGATKTPSYRSFVATLLNASRTPEYLAFVGPFMKYPLLPSPSRCALGHLTPVGVAQHIRLGALMREAYWHRLGMPDPPWKEEFIVVRSTKIRRTFQSALAFLFGFLPNFQMTTALRMQAATGVYFCGDFCRCDRALALERAANTDRRAFARAHPGVATLVQEISSILKAQPDDEDFASASTARDALLAFACHGAPMPCSSTGGAVRCTTPDDIAKLLSYEEWEARQSRSQSRVRAAKVSVFGLLQSIWTDVESMMSDNERRTRVWLYSAHDKTITALLISLGLAHVPLPIYAARLAVEVYRNASDNIKTNSNKDLTNVFFFRVLYNGKDITKQLPFCSGKLIRRMAQLSSPAISMGKIAPTAVLCPVPVMANFLLPNNYFKELNATSFNAACVS